MRPRSSSTSRASVPPASHAQVGRRSHPESVIADGQDLTSVDHELAPAGQAHWISPAGTVKGQGNRGTPLDDHRVAHFIFDMAPADVPRRAVGVVGAAEAQRVVSA